MKKLNYVSIPDRLYYYLLDFNYKDNKKTMLEITNGKILSISKLSLNDIKLLLHRAIESDSTLIEEIQNE